jgi:poly-gamma-glutamate capsule biosynthesis protein CapA/YwtB (metallophosphatase superfamily)
MNVQSGPQTSIRINFVGDLCLHNIDPARFFIDDSLLDLFSTADLNIANLECVLTRSECPAPHHPIHLKTKPDRNRILDLMHVFSLANNHIMDFGPEGLQETIDFLESCHKGHFGAGFSEEEASSPLLIEVRGKKLALLGCARWYPAAGRKPGTAPDKIRHLESITARAKASGHFVIVMPHWNYEYIYYPAPDNRELAKRLIEAGADLIVGAHPHVVQGHEQYRGKYIFHSLGNFLFSSDVFKDVDLSLYSESPALNESYVLSVDVASDDRYDFRFTPILTDDRGAYALGGSDASRFREKLEAISRVLLDDDVHARLFYEQARHVSRKSTGTLRNVASRQGIRSLLVLLTGLRKQDLKILVHSLLHRGGRTAPSR